MRLLIADDNIENAAMLSDALRTKLHNVSVARDGRDALFILEEETYDAMVINRNLLFIDGLAVLKVVRNRSNNVPVIVLSEHGGTVDTIESLNAGADDCCGCSVSIDELDARLHAVVRRPAIIGEVGVVRAGSVEINLLQHKVKRGGATVSLLPLEMKVLASLVRNSHRIMTRSMIVKEVWGRDAPPDTNIVDAKITRIRAKLNFDGLPDVIETVRGAGYILSDAA